MRPIDMAQEAGADIRKKMAYKVNIKHVVKDNS